MLVQYIGTILLLIGQVLYIGTVIYGPATALETVTDIPPWASIIFVGVIGTTYTAFGGMKAVIWTDVFQSSVMLAGLIAIIVQGSRKVGGFAYIWKANLEAQRLELKLGASLTERFSILSTLIGLTASYVGSFGVNQPCVQRYCALGTQGRGRLAILLNGPGSAIFGTLSMMVGMVAFAYYDKKRCDPLASGLIANGNQITPYFIMEILGYPGLPGLFMSSLFSACLSTFSSSLNSIAAVVWEDILVDHYSHLSEKTKTWITKGVSVFFGAVCTAMAFIIMSIGGNLIQITGSLFGIVLGPLLGVFVLGALFPFANWMGAVLGASVGLGLGIWLMVGQTLLQTQRSRLPTKTDGCFGYDAHNETSTLTNIWTDTTSSTADVPTSSFLEFLYSISFSWYPFIGFLLVVFVGIIASAVTVCIKHDSVEDKYMFPCIRRGRPEQVTYRLVQRSCANIESSPPMRDSFI